MIRFSSDSRRTPRSAPLSTDRVAAPMTSTISPILTVVVSGTAYS